MAIVVGRDEDNQFKSDFGDENEKLGYWSGTTAADLKAQYMRLRELGTLSAAHYIVRLRPYNQSGALSQFSLFIKLGGAVEWLAASVPISIVDAQVDSVQIGHFQQNFITANNENEVPITFIETANGDILKFADGLKGLMFSRDGTQGLPADYLMYLSVSVFDRANRGNLVFTKESLVALQSSSIELAGNSNEVLIVPLTFVKMFPMVIANEMV